MTGIPPRSRAVRRAYGAPDISRQGASSSKGSFAELKELAQSPAVAVLLSGGGAGAARQFHRMTHGNKRAPFVHVDCAWLPERGAGRLLFGSETGSADHRGFLERANGGTLF